MANYWLPLTPEQEGRMCKNNQRIRIAILSMILAFGVFMAGESTGRSNAIVEDRRDRAMQAVAEASLAIDKMSAAMAEQRLAIQACKAHLDLEAKP